MSIILELLLLFILKRWAPPTLGTT